MIETGDMLRKHCCVFYGLDGNELTDGHLKTRISAKRFGRQENRWSGWKQMDGKAGGGGRQIGNGRTQRSRMEEL